jgi:hypothetical protein
MRVPRTTGALSGALLVVLGLWGGLVPFVGPYFDFSIGTNSTWHYTTDRLWLCILPGAAVVLGGLALMAASSRPRGVLGGWLAVAGGAWFAAGPSLSLLWKDTAGIGQPLGSHTRQAFELVGYFYGVGALAIALAAFAMGRFASRPAVVEEPGVVDEPAVTERPVAEPSPAAATPVPATPPAATTATPTTTVAPAPSGTRRRSLLSRPRLRRLRGGTPSRS